jgi:hypothetical protein
LAELFQSGRIVDFILVLMVLELSALAAWRATGRSAPGVADVLPYLLSGAALLLALRLALTGSAWPLIALTLLAAFAAHLFDLYQRWPRAD